MTRSVRSQLAIPAGMLPAEWLAEPWQQWEAQLLPALNQLVGRVMRQVLEAIDARLALARDRCWQIEALRQH